jgi:hypothetical protein
VLVQGSKGATLGLAAGLGAIWLAGKRYPAFSQMPLPFKGFLCSGVTAGTALTFADRASLSFERKRYGGPGQEKIILPVDSDWKHKVSSLRKLD